MKKKLISKGHKISFWGIEDYVLSIGNKTVKTVSYINVPISECNPVLVVKDVLVKEVFIDVKYSLN